MIEIEEINYEKFDDDCAIDQRVAIAEESNNYESNPYTYRCEAFKITDDGKKLMERKDLWFSWKNLNSNQKEIIQDFKGKMMRSSLRDILSYVYTKYPKYTTESLIKDKVFKVLSV